MTLPPELINRVASFIEWRTDLARILRDKRPLITRCANCGNYLEIEHFEWAQWCILCDDYKLPRRVRDAMMKKSEELAEYRYSWDT
jgi:hypothetical protein